MGVIDSTSIKVNPDIPEGRKLIESVYSKNNNYLLIDRAYEDHKTLALVKDHGFNTVVPHKKNRKLPWSYDKQLDKQSNNIKRCFWRLKRFRKVFTRYNKLDSVFVLTISRTFIFDLFFMRVLPNNLNFKVITLIIIFKPKLFLNKICI